MSGSIRNWGRWSESDQYKAQEHSSMKFEERMQVNETKKGTRLKMSGSIRNWGRWSETDEVKLL